MGRQTDCLPLHGSALLRCARFAAQYGCCWGYRVWLRRFAACMLLDGCLRGPARARDVTRGWGHAARHNGRLPAARSSLSFCLCSLLLLPFLSSPLAPLPPGPRGRAALCARRGSRRHSVAAARRTAPHAARGARRGERVHRRSCFLAPTSPELVFLLPPRPPNFAVAAALCLCASQHTLWPALPRPGPQCTVHPNTSLFSFLLSLWFAGPLRARRREWSGLFLRLATLTTVLESYFPLDSACQGPTGTPGGARHPPCAAPTLSASRSPTTSEGGQGGALRC